MLGLLGIPYVGSLPSSCRIAFDKPVAKSLVPATGLVTPASVTLPRETFHDLGAAGVIDLTIGELGTQLFVKPSRGGSALGASGVQSASDLATAINLRDGDGRYDYTARYTAGETEFYTPARLTADIAEKAARVAVAAHVALGLRDLSRTDLIVDGSGTVYFLEVNVAPGMTSTSTLPMAMRAAGLEFAACCRTLLERAAARLT